MPSFYPQSRKAPNRPVIRHLLPRRIQSRYISICILGLYLDTLTASEGAAILIGRGPGFRPRRLRLGRCSVPYVGHPGAVLQGERHAEVVCLCCRGPATPGQQPGSVRRDAEPDCGPKPRICWVPGPEGCPATARHWLSSRVADQGCLGFGRHTPQCECLYCTSACTVHRTPMFPLGRWSVRSTEAAIPSAVTWKEKTREQTGRKTTPAGAASGGPARSPGAHDAPAGE